MVEAVTNSQAISQHMRVNRSGSLIGSGASGRSAVVAAHLPGV
jgi:hypothetical protein